MLKKGDLAPSFEGTDQSGNSLNLEELLSNGPVLLYFYPADFTPICTAQACAFRDRQDALTGVSLQIIGVSPQSESSHQRFADTYDLGFPLIPDQNYTLTSAIAGYHARFLDQIGSDYFSEEVFDDYFADRKF